MVDVLVNQETYWAHIHSDKKAELLHEHVELVNDYSKELVAAHGLDEVIDRLINSHVKEWENKQAAKFLKTLFVHSIVFHDFGKINENFQVRRMKNDNFAPVQNNCLNPSYGHSYLGAFIFLSYHIDAILKTTVSKEEKVTLISHCFFFVYPILQHHSPALFDVIERGGVLSRFQDVFPELKNYLLKYQLTEIDESAIQQIFKNIEALWYGYVGTKMPIVPFPLFALIKLNFSLLTASDYFATHEYINSSDDYVAKTENFGVFGKNRIGQIFNYLTKYKHNQATYHDLDTHQFHFPTERSAKNLNLLRKQMAVAVVQNIRTNTNSRLFYLEAPTGGGKTNLSALVVAELLIANPELNKVFYVFPFTTLITQTFSSLKESMDLKSYEILELHSKAPFTTTQDKEKSEDGLYADEKKDFIDRLFALCPLALMSHVKFFDILKTNGKEQNYLLHRLANSIVVIDELQSYNPAIWDKMLFFIEKYAHFFNIRFVLMSATLPKISNLKVGFKDAAHFVDLLPDANKYMANANFGGRVSFNFELYTQEKIDLETLSHAVLTKSKAYCEENGSVKTIVEFIYKKSATAFQKLFAQNEFFDEVFVLSGTILESRRREIINFIKCKAAFKVNILLITTQVVEAGVDIDMDLGFKNVSLLDSDEQLAGRVNRNAAKKFCEVYLFNIDDARVLYGKDYRYKKTREMPMEERQSILNNKDFRKLYEQVLLSIDDLNNPVYKDSITGYKKLINDLRYTDIDREFKIIDQDSCSVFVPTYIPVHVMGISEGLKDAIFTVDEMSFLAKNGINPFDYNFGSSIAQAVCGEEIWNLYVSLIEEQKIQRMKISKFNILDKINFKTLQSILSKFCFSLISRSKDFKEMQVFGKEEYGYFYFSHFDECRENGKPYEYFTGLNSDAFSDSNFI